MDIWNNKSILQASLTRFTLKATAAAVLALYAEGAMAVNCPTEITGTFLAGIICDFNGVPPSGSTVTVENGGEVGGIRMANFQPTDSHITVNAGGLVNSTGIGIAITSSSSLSNGLANNGTINALTGVAIDLNSVVNGGISNTGLISAVNVGISIATGTVSNGISNSGTISSTSGVGISILNSSAITGGILNSGAISSNTTGITIGNNSLVNGGISNNGTINSNVATGIRINSSSIGGSIFNSGTISGGGVDSGISIIGNSAVNGNIINQGLINAQSGNAIALNQSIITGGISNSGRIESTNANGLSVSNVSTIQGNITNSGLLTGGINGISILSASTVGGIANSGTISGVNNGLHITSATINGSITNTGTISGSGTGVNISSSAVSGGISNSGTIQGDIFAIRIANGTVSHIDILGQQARIIGAVDAVNTEVNITNGAVFTSEGTYNVNAFNVSQNAIFNMANTVTVAAGFNNAGTLAVSNGLQTIVGDYTQNTGGIFQTAVSSTANYGQLSATGTVDLSQSGNINVQIAPNATLHAGDVFTNVINGNTFIQPTDGFNVTDNSFIWEFIPGLNNTNNGVNLTLGIDPAVYTVCQGNYCQGAANTIIAQIAAGNSLFSPYGSLSTASAFQTAASQATPELTNENIQIIQLLTQTVVDVAPMWSNLRGRSSGDAMLYQPGKMWVKPYWASMTQNEQSTVNGFNATAYGVVAGKDIELSNDWMLGGALAAGGDHIKGKSVLNGQTINSNAFQGMLYGSKKLPNQFYVAGQGLVGYEDNNTSRAIPLYASTAKGSYNSWFTNFRAEGGWSTNVFSPNLVFTPQIDASYLFINQESYHESGSPMALAVAANNNSSLVLGVYGNGAYHATSLQDQYNLTLTAYVGVADDLINSQPQVTSTFVAGGSSFSTYGVEPNEAVFRGGVGLNLASPTKPLIAQLNYDVQAGNNARSGVGVATIIYKL